MATYCINRVVYGEPERTVMEVEARSAEMAWHGSKSWFISGTFYVFPKGDYAAGRQFTKEDLHDYYKERTVWQGGSL